MDVNCAYLLIRSEEIRSPDDESSPTGETSPKEELSDYVLLVGTQVSLHLLDPTLPPRDNAIASLTFPVPRGPPRSLYRLSFSEYFPELSSVCICAQGRHLSMVKIVQDLSTMKYELIPTKPILIDSKVLGTSSSPRLPFSPLSHR